MKYILILLFILPSFLYSQNTKQKTDTVKWTPYYPQSGLHWDPINDIDAQLDTAISLKGDSIFLRGDTVKIPLPLKVHYLQIGDMYFKLSFRDKEIFMLESVNTWEEGHEKWYALPPTNLEIIKVD